MPILMNCILMVVSISSNHLFFFKFNSNYFSQLELKSVGGVRVADYDFVLKRIKKIM